MSYIRSIHQNKRTHAHTHQKKKKIKSTMSLDHIIPLKNFQCLSLVISPVMVTVTEADWMEAELEGSGCWPNSFANCTSHYSLFSKTEAIDRHRARAIKIETDYVLARGFISQTETSWGMGTGLWPPAVIMCITEWYMALIWKHSLIKRGRKEVSLPGTESLKGFCFKCVFCVPIMEQLIMRPTLSLFMWVALWSLLS